MALGNYVTGYLGVDSDENFQLVKEDLDDHERKLSAHRSDFTSFGNKLKAISDEAEDIISLSGAGSKSILNVVSEINAMKRTVSNLKEKWNKYDNSYRGFKQVQDLIAQTAALLNSTLSVPRGYSYSPGSFRKLMSKNFVDALIANNNYAQNPANQKAFQANWDKILKNYKIDQKRMDDIRKEANRHKGAWEVVFGVGAVVIGVVAIVATAGAATPLVAVAYASGFGAIDYGTSNAFERSQIVVTGADKAFNPLRDTVFQGNQIAYDTFGNVSMFVAGSVIPVGAALKAGEPVTRAFIAGVGRTSVTTAVGAVTNFVVALIVTSLAKSAGIDPILANDLGIGTGFATSIFTAGKAYKACGDGAEVEEIGNAENLAKVNLDTREMSDIERTNYILEHTDLTREQVQDYFDINYYRNPEVGDTFRNEGIIKSGNDVLIPRSTKYLDEDGFINWELAPEKGYVLDDKGNAIRDILMSKPSGNNRMFDRYGNEYGNYLSPVDSEGNSYAFEKRALPYVEDATTHHVYEETGDLSNIRNDIIKSSLSDSRKQELLNKLGDNKTYIGEAKGAYDQIGGAEQVETPLSIKELCEIGTLTER